MDKNIEIEIRGPLSKEKFDALIDLFEIKGKKITEKDRVLIDYSTFLEELLWRIKYLCIKLNIILMFHII